MKALENAFYLAATGFVAKEAYEGYGFMITFVKSVFQPLITALGM